MRSVQTRSLRNRFFNNIDKLEGRRNRLLLTLIDDKLRNTLAPTLLTVAVNNIRQLLFLIMVDNIFRVQLRFLVHAHVERTVMHIGKATLRCIQLVARHAQVEENTVNLLNAHAV